MTKRRRQTPDQIIRKIAEGHKLLAGGAELDKAIIKELAEGKLLTRNVAGLQ